MKKIFILMLIICLYASTSWGAVIFNENFNSLSASSWTVTQGSSATSCEHTESCGMTGTTWTGYYNGACKCTNTYTGWPGNNLIYMSSYADAPDNTIACRGGSGKCATFWLESCTVADDSDGQLTRYFDTEYEELYLRFYIKFKSGWERRELQGGDGAVTKFFHIQHYLDGSPHAYHGTNTGNQPMTVFLLTEYQTTVQAYVEVRCQTDYYCHGTVVWDLGSTTWAYAAGGIYDGDWHSIEFRIKRNSSIGVADGEVQLWYDGTEASMNADRNSWNDLPWNDTGSSELRGWRWFNIGGNTNNYYEQSSTDMADREQWYAIDDVCVSTSYIGTGSCDGAPSAPTGITIIYD